MTTINTTDDLLRALAENPEWKEAVRRAILTEELISLPARFDQFVTEQRQFNDEQGQFNDRIDRFVDEQGQFNDRIDRFVDEQGQFNDRMDRFVTEQRQFNDRIDRFVDEQGQFNDRIEQFVDEQGQFNERMEQFVVRTDRRFVTLADDISRMRGSYARAEAARYADAIVDEIGFQKVRTLDPSELVRMTRTADTSGITRGDLRSFHIADLVIEANDDKGDVHYIAIEVSFTADHRDTDRAIRNARLLTRFTGHPAHAAIGSVRNDREIQDVIDRRQVYWYELEERDPESE